MEGEGKTVTLSLGKSILVPSVQELAKGCLKEIPERYVVRSDLDDEPPIITKDEDDPLIDEVPIINMDALISGDEFELEKLHSASQHWGFFQLINHGVNSSLVEKFKLETQEFFNLPLEEKKKYWQTPTDLQGFGQAFVVSEEQKLDWADMFYMITLPKHLRKSNLFPKLPLPYRDTLESYSGEMKTLARKILGYMAKALGPERAMGLKAHSDETCLITILLQTNQVEGLQIKNNGKWVPISPLPHAFVVNIGDVLEIMSNGIYRSVTHRAVVNATKERVSVATFHSPALDHEVSPIPQLITSTTPARFRRISMVDYWKAFLGRPLDGKKCLETLRILENA